MPAFYLALTCICFLFSSVASQSYDYIVVGGGTAGLAVAARIAQNSTYTVAVIEAGGTGADNTGISIPGFTGTTFGTGVDWSYFIQPQADSNNVSFLYPRGKVLGGHQPSTLWSTLALVVLTQMQSKRLKSWMASLFPWIRILVDTNINYILHRNWDNLFATSKETEKLVNPGPDANYTYVPSYHGTDGPVYSSFPTYVPAQVHSYIPAVKALGHAVTEDGMGGDATGAWIYPSTIDITGPPTRLTSANAYYHPNSGLENLVVITNAMVDKLVSNTTDTGVTVTGVTYTGSTGAFVTLSARKEVIMSAGSIGTPAILERSGMGNPKLLSSLGIDCTLSLPTIGSNLADHFCNFGTYKLKPGFDSLDKLNFDPAFLAESLASYALGEGILTSQLSVLDYQPLSNMFNSTVLEEGYALLTGVPDYLSEKEYNTVVNSIKTSNAVEFLIANLFFEDKEAPSANTSYMMLATCLQHPLSRGSTHISSSDPTASPSIDPGYFSHTFDLWLMAKSAAHARKIMNQSAWADVIDSEQYPGLGVQTDEEWVEAVKNRVRTEYHPIGTASLKPKDLGGVVDPNLLVYGTTNLRVVDASVIPVHMAAHPVLAIYALAEGAAQMVLASA